MTDPDPTTAELPAITIKGRTYTVTRIVDWSSAPNHVHYWLTGKRGATYKTFRLEFWRDQMFLVGKLGAVDPLGTDVRLTDQGGELRRL